MNKFQNEFLNNYLLIEVFNSIICVHDVGKLLSQFCGIVQRHDELKHVDCRYYPIHSWIIISQCVCEMRSESFPLKASAEGQGKSIVMLGTFSFGKLIIALRSTNLFNCVFFYRKLN